MPDTVTISRKAAPRITRWGDLLALGDEDLAARHELEAALRSDDGWTTVSEENPLPDDLQDGDEIQHEEIRTMYGGNSCVTKRRPTAYRRSSKEGK